MHFILYINNSHESRLNFLGLLTNSTQDLHVCLVASGGLKPVTFRSQSPTLSLYTTHVDSYSVPIIQVFSIISAEYDRND